MKMKLAKVRASTSQDVPSLDTSKFQTVQKLAENNLNVMNTDLENSQETIEKDNGFIEHLMASGGKFSPVQTGRPS